jgi:WhiB family redox-sensing transcriptional regulator
VFLQHAHGARAALRVTDLTEQLLMEGRVTGVLAELLAEALVTMLEELDRRHPWRLDALCREPGYDPDLFFPPRGASTDAAKALCQRCTVRHECSDFVTAGGGSGWTRNGIWAGQSARQRRS